MSELMNISVNGQSQVPPGFRFHLTEEELLHYYLRKRISHEKIDLDVIRDVDLNKLEPWDIQERCKIGSAGQTDWYLFSHKDKKYPSGTRMNRATAAGFWKATGRDKEIYSSRNILGLRKTLVFYTGRAPRGLKSDWIMYEYRLLDRDEAIDSQIQEEGWVICRIFKKRSHQQRGYAAEARSKLMAEEKRVETVIKGCDWFDDEYAVVSTESDGSDNITKWGEVDQLVAGQLNGQTETGDEQSCFDVDTKIMCGPPALPYLAHHHQQLQFQSLSSLTNHNEICSLWGFT